MKFTVTLDVSQPANLLELKDALSPWFDRENAEKFIIVPHFSVDYEVIELVIAKSEEK